MHKTQHRGSLCNPATGTPFQPHTQGGTDGRDCTSPTDSFLWEGQDLPGLGNEQYRVWTSLRLEAYDHLRESCASASQGTWARNALAEASKGWGSVGHCALTRARQHLSLSLKARPSLTCCLPKDLDTSPSGKSDRSLVFQKSKHHGVTHCPKRGGLWSFFFVSVSQSSWAIFRMLQI